MRLGRPVKWIEDRREHFLSATQERDQYWKVAIAVDRRRQNPRPARHHDPRQRRLSAVGHHHALHRGDDVSRPLCGAGVPVRDHGRAHQPGADHGGARRRPAAGGLRHGAADGPGRARTRHRPRRTAPPQHDRAGADALQRRPGVPRRQAARLCERRFPKSQTRAWRMADYDGFRARQARARARPAATSASASAITSKAPGSGRSKASPCASCPTARSRSRPAPPPRARAPTRRCRRSSPTGWAAASSDIVVTAGDTNAISQGVGAFASRQAINAGCSAMMAGDHVRQQVVALAARTLGVAEDRDRRRGRPRHGARRQQAGADLRRTCPPRPGHAGLLAAAGPGAGPRTHRLFHAAPGVLLQRHPCGRGRGRSDDRRRDHPQLRGRRTTAATSSIR